MTYLIMQGDCIESMRSIPDKSVQCCVTSPPYWGLRDYGVDGQIGLEPSLDAYVARMVEVFREVRRCLRDDGTLWLNLGDSYNAGTSAPQKPSKGTTVGHWQDAGSIGNVRCNAKGSGLKTKDLCMIPWRVALALQADGWWLRSVIAWAKKSPMPESVTDRPTSSWEPIFLLAKSEKYYYDAEAVKEPCGEFHAGGKNNGLDSPKVPDPRKKQDALGKQTYTGFNKRWSDNPVATRNQRNVWHLGPEPYAEAHFATFPTEIPRRAIMAGSRPGDTILDPFSGSGTTGAVALQLDRTYIGCELNPDYIRMSHDRIGKATRPATYQSSKVVDAPLFMSNMESME